MEDYSHILAHANSSRHREQILSSELCGCFYCCAIFSPSEITKWVETQEGIGQTATCPKCRVDSVIGSASGYPITKEFLMHMMEFWFQ